MRTARREQVILAAAQRRLLPQAAPEFPGYELCLAYRPTRVVTGDYHDFFPRPDGRLAVFVGDGSGHGPVASMLTTTMRTILHTHARLHRNPGATLSRVAPLFYATTVADQFMTGVYLLLGEKGRVSWASAGHDPPQRVSPRGEVTPVDLGPVGLPLGLSAATGYATVRWRLCKGERLLLFTDGLVETRREDGEVFGRHRLRAGLAGLASVPLPEMVRRLIAQAEAHQRSGQFEDDVTIVAVERVA
ncbi:MAG TPA: PP2C family protein-serine/threonine phosphatase [Gemmataceae bacterium]|nr:PP2C family protein-serine/threonine phosphatase [Gemmataceae bacterium]